MLAAASLAFPARLASCQEDGMREGFVQVFVGAMFCFLDLEIEDVGFLLNEVLMEFLPGVVAAGAFGPDETVVK